MSKELLHIIEMHTEDIDDILRAHPLVAVHLKNGRKTMVYTKECSEKIATACRALASKIESLYA